MGYESKKLSLFESRHLLGVCVCVCVANKEKNINEIYEI